MAVIMRLELTAQFKCWEILTLQRSRFVFCVAATIIAAELADTLVLALFRISNCDYQRCSQCCRVGRHTVGLGLVKQANL
jgi:hypothetical protein